MNTNNLPLNHEFKRFRIVLVGAGGTGGNLAPMIARLISDLDDVELTIVDGDDVEKSNLERQPYLDDDLGLNKAEILSTKLNSAFNLNTTYYPLFIKSEDQLEDLLQYNKNRDMLNILIGAVDNHNARVLMEQFFFNSSNLIYIDSANEDYFGDVIAGAKLDGEVILNTRGMYRPLEIMNGSARVKSTSCEVKVNDNPQYYPTNQMAATIVLKMISDIVVESQIISHFVNFDTNDYLMFKGIEGVEKDCEQNYVTLTQKNMSTAA